MLDNFTFEEWKTLFERFRAESKNDDEAFEKLGDYIRKVLFGCDWLDKRWISYERCEEINRMKIPCPWGGYEDVYKPYYIMNEKGSQYYSSEDESIILGRAFTPRHDDRDREGRQDTYFLIKGKEYYLFTFVAPHNAPPREAKKLGEMILEVCPPIKGTWNIFYVKCVVEIGPNIKIDSSSDKQNILRIIKDYEIFKANNFANEVYDVTVLYRGKEVK